MDRQTNNNFYDLLFIQKLEFIRIPFLSYKVFNAKFFKKYIQSLNKQVIYYLKIAWMRKLLTDFV